MADFGGGDVEVELALLDLDGTLYLGTRPVPGAVEAVARLRAWGTAVRFVTNSDLLTPAALRQRLAGMGIEATEEEILTPIVLAGEFFASVPAVAVLAVTAPARIVKPEMNRITMAMRCTTSSTICITSATLTTVTVGNLWYMMRCRAGTSDGRTRALP